MRKLGEKAAIARSALFRRRPATAGSKPARTARLAFEPLEPRLVLNDGPLVISEFMAINHTTLQDEDKNFPDWIEIHNPTDTAVDLDGWYLTDKADKPTKWKFPAYVLDPLEYLNCTPTSSSAAAANILAW